MSLLKDSGTHVVFSREGLQLSSKRSKVPRHITVLHELERPKEAF